MNATTRSDGAQHTAKQWDAAAALLVAAAAPAGCEVAWAQALALLKASRRDGVHLIASVIVIDAGGLAPLGRQHRYRR